MTCAEFQKALPYIIETGGNAEQEEHLRTCATCSDLVADLKYIAECAKLLVPMVEPSPRVWNEISKSLESEGLVRKATPRGRLLVPTQSSRWGPAAWIAAAAVAVLIIASLSMYRAHSSRIESASLPAAPLNASLHAVTYRGMSDADDQQLLQQVSTASPSLKDAYQVSLQRVNSYIADAQKSLQQNPDDADAQQHLRNAYEQKTMLYDMATARSLP
jgi:hypothetical protein